jgi:acyl-CoA thioesterase YciA
VEFHEPVFVGDLLSLYSETVRIGRTSIRVRVTVFANRHSDPTQRVKVTQGDLTYVAIDKDWKKVPIRPES